MLNVADAHASCEEHRSYSGTQFGVTTLKLIILCSKPVHQRTQIRIDGESFVSMVGDQANVKIVEGVASVYMADRRISARSVVGVVYVSMGEFGVDAGSAEVRLSVNTGGRGVGARFAPKRSNLQKN